MQIGKLVLYTSMCAAMSLFAAACSCPQNVGSSSPGTPPASGPTEPGPVVAEPGYPAEPGPDRTPATPGADHVPATPGPDRTPATPGTPTTPGPDYTPGTPGNPSANGDDSAPGQGQPCPENVCADGLACVTYYGIAGPRGPKFTSCEIRCTGGNTGCPAGQVCVTIADGPGQVCRPRSP